MRNRGARAVVVGLLLVALAAVGGCGSGGSPSSGTAVPLSASRKASPGDGSNATVGNARAAGRRACRDAGPLEVARRYERPAVAAGVDKKFAALAAEPTAAMRSSPGYPRLVAAIYAGTLAPSQRAEAAAGCAEELASR